jgi:hypothetical protein
MDLVPQPKVPPPFDVVRLREHGDAFQQAVARAGEGPGTLVYVGRFDAAEFAVTLEPGEPLRHAGRIFCLNMMALADTLAGLIAAETPLLIEWPDRIKVNGRDIAFGRLAWPPGFDEGSSLPWLVFGAIVRVAASEADVERVDVMAADQLAGSTEDIVESFSRHLLAWSDRYQELGFAPVMTAYRDRCGAGAAALIDDCGDMIGSQEEGGRSLLQALALPAWRAHEETARRAEAPR